MTHNVESYHLWDSRWRTRASKTHVCGCRCAHGVRELRQNPSVRDSHTSRRCLTRLLLRQQRCCHCRDSCPRLPQQEAEVRADLDLFRRGGAGRWLRFLAAALHYHPELEVMPQMRERDSGLLRRLVRPVRCFLRGVNPWNLFFLRPCLPRTPRLFDGAIGAPWATDWFVSRPEQAGTL